MVNVNACCLRPGKDDICNFMRVLKIAITSLIFTLEQKYFLVTEMIFYSLKDDAIFSLY